MYRGKNTRDRQVSFTSSVLLSPRPAKAVIKRQNCEENFISLGLAMSGFNFTSGRVQFVALGVSIPQGFRVFPVSSTRSTLSLVYPYRTVSHT
jgi:hypothetical protein